jgi:hypothetical protein
MGAKKVAKRKAPARRSAADATRAAPRTRASLKLFWCTTPDHDEDWFIIARTAAAARRCHEADEGYAGSTAEAEYVCDVPERFASEAPGWPSDAALKASGAEYIVKEGGPRVVRVAGRVFGEGDIAANAAANVGTLYGAKGIGTRRRQ